MIIGYNINNNKIKVITIDTTPEKLLKEYPTRKKVEALFNDNSIKEIDSYSKYIDLGGEYIFIDYLFTWKKLINGILCDP